MFVLSPFRAGVINHENVPILDGLLNAICKETLTRAFSTTTYKEGLNG
jgi:hypothetical protein